MKSLASVLSSLFVGLLLGASNFAPILELQRFLAHRKRVAAAAAVFAGAFVFLMAGLLLGSIDLTFQYDDQGFVFWNALLSLAVGFIVLSAVLAWTARAILPKPGDSLAPGMTENVLQVLQSIMAHATSSEPNAKAPEERPPEQPSAPAEAPISTTATYEPQPGYAH